MGGLGEGHKSYSKLNGGYGEKLQKSLLSFNKVRLIYDHFQTSNCFPLPNIQSAFELCR